MSVQSRSLGGLRIGVFGRGGAGKSTMTVLLAKALRTRGYDVCVIDADSTNQGLHQALGLDHAPNSLVEYFGGLIFSGGDVTCPVDDPSPLPNARLSLAELPREYYAINTEGILLLSTGKIVGRGPGPGCDGPMTKIARDVTISMADRIPITLIDFKAGSEDIARGAITRLDWALVVVDPTTTAMEMARSTNETVNEIRAGLAPATAHLTDAKQAATARSYYREALIKGAVFVGNKIEDEEMEQYMLRGLSVRGVSLLGVVHRAATVSKAWLEGQPVEDTKAQEEVDLIVQGLENLEYQGSGNGTWRLAVITDNGTNVSKHAGRAPHYLVLTIKDGRVIHRELRRKPSHREFSGECGHGDSDHDGQHEKHGMSQGARRRHERMLEVIRDCTSVMSGGLGPGMQRHLDESGLDVVLTEATDIDEAIRIHLERLSLGRPESVS